jgi:hypothetical protein
MEINCTLNLPQSTQRDDLGENGQYLVLGSGRYEPASVTRRMSRAIELRQWYPHRLYGTFIWSPHRNH